MVDYVTRAERRKNSAYRIAELEAELERLREENTELRVIAEKATQWGEEALAEVERLERQLSACKDIDKELGVLRETVERLRAENERWRERVKHLPDHSDCRAMLKDLCDRIDFEAESKRLARMVSGVAPGRCEWVEYHRARQALEETT
jgi:predicted RNase H-like nuclease (RuvC/YqgF family)